jgi:hypothetical protein
VWESNASPAAAIKAIVDERKRKPGEEAVQPLRQRLHLRAEAELPSKGRHLHKVQEEGPPCNHLSQKERG